MVELIAAVAEAAGLTKKDAFLLVLNGIINPFIEKIFNEELKNEIIKQLTLLIKE